MLKKSLFLFSLLLVINSYALPQEKKTLTLKDCIDLAIQNNQDIQLYDEDEKQAVAEYRKSLASKLPYASGVIKTVQVQKEGTTTTGTYGQHTETGLFAGISAGYTIYKPGRSQTIDISRIQVEIKKIKIKSNLNTILRNVKLNFYKNKKANNDSVFKKSVMDKYKSMLDILRIQSKTDEIRPITISNLEVSYQSAVLDYEASKQLENSTKYDLFNAMGIEVFDVDLKSDDMNNIPELAYKPDELVKMAMQNSNEIAMADLSMEAGKLGVSAAKEQHLPNISIIAGLGYQNNYVQNSPGNTLKGSNWDPTFGAFVQSEVSIFNGGAINANIDSVTSDFQKSKISRNKTVLQVKNTVLQYSNTLEYLKKQISINKVAVKNAETNLTIVLRGYSSGTSSQFNITEATETLLKSKQMLLDTQINYLMTISDLSTVIGLSEESICKK